MQHAHVLSACVATFFQTTKGDVLLEALSSRADSDRNGMISVSELTGYLTRRVPGLTNGAQQPGVEMRFDGDVFLAKF